MFVTASMKKKYSNKLTSDESDDEGFVIPETVHDTQTSMVVSCDSQETMGYL
jgi:hypothetical protein